MPSEHDKPVCTIGNCTAPATRALHFPSIDTWLPYCAEHTPLKRHDDERSLESEVADE